MCHLFLSLGCQYQVINTRLDRVDGFALSTHVFIETSVTASGCVNIHYDILHDRPVINHVVTLIVMPAFGCVVCCYRALSVVANGVYSVGCISTRGCCKLD